MKTNINKFTTLYDMQLHKAEIVKALFKDHLSYGYTDKAIDAAKKQGLKINSQFVRSVKSGAIKDLQVFNILIELAKKNKADAEAAKQKLNQLI